jgi:hypothetical protein
MNHRSFHFVRRGGPVFLITILVTTPPIMAWLHDLYPRTPVWMSAGPAFVAAVVLFATVTVRVARSRRDPDAGGRGVYGPGRRPGWLGWLDRIVGTGVVVWFAPELQDRWQREYPGTPSWMSFTTSMTLLVVLTAIPVDILALSLSYLRRRRDAIDGPPTTGTRAFDVGA